MANRLTGSTVLDGGSGNADAPFGDGVLSWVVTSADITAPAGPVAGSPLFQVASGFGVPSGTLGGRITATRAAYLRNDGTAATTIYVTVDTGTTWTAIAVP